MQDIEQIKGTIAMLMVGGAEHAELLGNLRTWAIRNEARIWTAMSFDVRDAKTLQHEHKRWNMLIDIFDNVAQEINLEKQNEQQK